MGSMGVLRLLPMRLSKFPLFHFRGGLPRFLASPRWCIMFLVCLCNSVVENPEPERYYDAVAGTNIRCSGV